MKKFKEYIKEFIESRKSKHDIMNEIIYYHNIVYKYMHEHENDFLSIIQRKTEEIEPLYNLQDVLQNFYDYTENNYTRLPNLKIVGESFSTFHNFMQFQLDRANSSIVHGIEEISKHHYEEALKSFDIAYSQIHTAIKIFLSTEKDG
jgi:hypothetical protein